MSLRERTRPGQPCLPSPAKAPPSGLGWLHEIKHNGFRNLARRDSAELRLITRSGNEFSDRFPFIAMAVNELPVRSCLIDGEAIVCDETGLAVFDLIRRQRAGECSPLRLRFAGARRQGSALRANREAESVASEAAQRAANEHRP